MTSPSFTGHVGKCINDVSPSSLYMRYNMYALNPPHPHLTHNVSLKEINLVFKQISVLKDISIRGLFNEELWLICYQCVNSMTIFVTSKVHSIGTFHDFHFIWTRIFLQKQCTDIMKRNHKLCQKMKGNRFKLTIFQLNHNISVIDTVRE